MTSAMVKSILEQLPHLTGRLAADANLARLSWFRTGGPAEVLFEPANEDDLKAFLRRVPGHIPITMIGVGSNLLIRDGGVEGIVIRLGRGFAETCVRGDVMKAGAGAMDVHVARAAQKAGVTGLEFLVGVPGTIGGALRMNAGAYGQEIKDVLVHAHAIDRYGHTHEFRPEDFGFGYRTCKISSDMIFLSASFHVSNGDPVEIQKRMDEISNTRQKTQPIGTQTGGSTFKNPEGHKAWKLIEAAGCRGLRIGDAQVSEKHCNFLINLGGATAEDIETLGETVRERVKAESGIDLEWEIARIGQPAMGQT